ncbi:MAG: hypothetical protein KatS3mg127_0203 [Silanimonas sp.]|nr:MAG: hypothetical protein KatS3mg127_0203 [Silanimonas sp.]
MNLRDLRYLLALAQLRHFGRAAEACHVSQPTLSTQIRKLEEELGVTLVERAPRKVMLTEAGAEIAQRARRVMAEVEQMREIARRSHDPEAGTLRLGLFPTLGPYLLPHVVGPLRERFPRLELLLVEEKTELLLGQLREGRLDAAILALPVDDEGLEHALLFDEPFVLAVPERHVLAAPGAAPCTSRSYAMSTCCCWRTATACVSRRSMSASSPGRTRRTASAPPRSRPCGRWWPPEWASPCCRCWR